MPLETIAATWQVLEMCEHLSKHNLDWKKKNNNKKGN